jgi:ABC-type transporter Mla subunit MlaD
VQSGPTVGQTGGALGGLIGKGAGKIPGAAKGVLGGLTKGLAERVEEEKIAKALKGAEVKGRKDVERISKVIKKVLEDLKKRRRIGDDTLRKFNEVVPSNAADLEKDLRAMNQEIGVLERLEAEQFNNIKTALASAFPPGASKGKWVVDLENELKEIESYLTTEFKETRNELEKYNQRLSNEAATFVNETRAGEANIRAANDAIAQGQFAVAREKMRFAEKSFEAVKEILDDMERNFKRLEEVTNVIRKIEKAKEKLEKKTKKTVAKSAQQP